MNLRIRSNTVSTKEAKKSVEFIRHMATLELYNIEDIHAHGVLSKSEKAFFEKDSIPINHKHNMDINPTDYTNTISFGIRVSFDRGEYLIYFIKTRKGCFCRGSGLLSPESCGDKLDKQQALHDYLWQVLVTETIKDLYLPNLDIYDNTHYHKSKPPAEVLSDWRFNDKHRGTTNERDFRNLTNHNLLHLLKHCGWDKSILAIPHSQRGRSVRMNLLNARLSHDTGEAQEYCHIEHLRKEISMAKKYLTQVGTGLTM